MGILFGRSMACETPQRLYRTSYGLLFSLARGKPGCLGCTCLIRVRFFFSLHTVLRAQSAPGFPCALSAREGQRNCRTRAKSSRENAAGCLKQNQQIPLSSRTSERSERDPGPITTGLRFAKAGAPARSNNTALWLWVPAFAGTTPSKFANAPITSSSPFPAPSPWRLPAPAPWRRSGAAGCPRHARP